MISLTKTFPFAFNKRSFIIGFIILFFGILLTFGYVAFTFHLAKTGAQPSPEFFKVLNIVGELIKLVGYSILFSFVFIRAKQDAYGLPIKNPSNEFLIRVFLTIFCTQVLFDILCFFSLRFMFGNFLNHLLATPNQDTAVLIKYFILPFSGFLIFISYFLYMFWTSYIMNFNFSRFGFKLVQSLKKPLVYLQILGFSILYILIVIIPIIFASVYIGGIIQGLNPFARETSDGFWIITILLGLFLGFFYTLSKIGRLMGVLYTILFLVTFGLTKCIISLIFPFDIPFPVTGILSAYCWFSVMCFIFTIGTVVIPTGINHLFAQGAYQVNKSFDPSIEKEEETLLPDTNSEQQPDSLNTTTSEPQDYNVPKI